MKQILVIGSTVADVIIRLDHLPVTCEDVHVLSQSLSLGGCAYNVFHIIRHFGVPCTLFSPIGTGVYGDFVRSQLAAQGITSPIPTPDRDNGCCYCFVEAGGERTFISHHGAEYIFERGWLEALDPAEIGAVYLCGLEIEEPSGDVLLDFLEAHPGLPLYFAPGPRITKIPRERMERLFALRPILHLNEAEALSAAREFAPQAAGGSVQEAAAALCGLTGSAVIVTLGKQGCWYHTPDEQGLVPGVTVRTLDTIGAGDSHIGAVMAERFSGASWPQALERANRVAAAVVSVSGTQLSDEAFQVALNRKN